MAPIFWFNLLLFFISVYIIFIIMNYFCFIPMKFKSDELVQLTTTKEKSWKW